MRLNLIMWEKQSGYRANFVAEKLGISTGSYSRIKSGKQNPTLDLAFKFSEEFGNTVPNGDVLELFKNT